MNYFDWIRTFYRYYYLFFECDNINLLHFLDYYFIPISRDYFFNISNYRNFLDNFNRNFNFFLFNTRNRFLLNNFNRFINIEIMMCLFFIGLRYGYRNNDLFFNRYFNNILFDDFFLNYSVDKLRNLYYNFDYPWNRYYFLNYHLNWFYNWYLHYFVDDFIDSHWDLFYNIFCDCYGNYLFGLTVDYFWFGHYNRHLFFVDLWDVFGNHLLLDTFYRDQVGHGHFFDQRFLNN